MEETENQIVNFTYRGEDPAIIPQNATHVRVHNSITVIPERAFYQHPNIVEFICHDGVERIKSDAFSECPRLTRIVAQGLKVMESSALIRCRSLKFVECDKLEILEQLAIGHCISLMIVELPSLKVAEQCAFIHCSALSSVYFGESLERLGGSMFYGCKNLLSVSIPLKQGLINQGRVFQECKRFMNVDFVEWEPMREAINALLIEEWSYEIYEEMNSLNQILRRAQPGICWSLGPHARDEEGEKAEVVQGGIRIILGKIRHYKDQHLKLVGEATSRLQSVLPNDIVMNSVAPFLELPSHRIFEEEDSMFDEEE